MNEHDFDSDLEATLRAGLKSAVPPAAPEHVRDGVVRLAHRNLEEAAYHRSLPAWRRPFARRPVSSLRRGVGAVAAVAICVALVSTAVELRSGGGPGSGGTTPTPMPTDRRTEAAASLVPWTENDGHTSGVVSIGGWLDPETAWVVVSNDSGHFLRFTSDGGRTWSEARKLPGTTESAEFVDALHGWTSGIEGSGTSRRGVVYRTLDGGRTWEAVPLMAVAEDRPAEPVVLTVHFSDGTHGRALSARSLLDAAVPPGAGPVFIDCRRLVSADGGAHWSDPTAVSCAEMQTFTWADARHGYATSGLFGRAVTITEDGGASRGTTDLPGIPSGFTFQPELFEVVGEGDFRIAGTYMPLAPGAEPLPFVVYETTNNAVGWREVSRFADPALIQAAAAAPGLWYALSEDRGTTPHLSRLLESTDAGRTWRQVSIETVHAGGVTYKPGGSSGLAAAQLSFADAEHGMLQGVYMDCGDRSKSCGGSGTVFVTDDGGRTWHQVPF